VKGEPQREWFVVVRREGRLHRSKVAPVPLYLSLIITVELVGLANLPTG